MATCKIWGRSNDIGQLIDYDENPDKTTLDRNTDYLNALVNYTTDGFKTSKGQLVSGINCSPKNAKQEMMTALQINPRNRKLVNVFNRFYLEKSRRNNVIKSEWSLLKSYGVTSIWS